MINEIVFAFEVRPHQVAQWNETSSRAIAGDVFERAGPSGGRRRRTAESVVAADRSAQIRAGLAQKNVACCVKDRRQCIEPNHSTISIARQCELLNLARSSCYYSASGESEENLHVMRLLDEQYTRTPFYGVRRMVIRLNRMGHAVNPKRIRGLMRLMGLEPIDSKPRLSQAGPDHKICPYLLRGVPIERANQVWSSDITYVRLRHGFVYLVAIMDSFTRYVLSWEISASMETSFCGAALDWALRCGKPEIFNTDQGVQFTSHDFTARLLDRAFGSAWTAAAGSSTISS
ncbi:MAG TPA: IS3 family transposase [Acidobacteriota bacterium]|nr:IS3 family transposase [Acidobacteriota bacterium]HRT69839.1 IS3 family transposase [Syntrophales bacterium]HXK60460.1 IS3 family transposase [Acidobacteriota bacterium]